MGEILKVRNLTKRFKGLTAVNDVSFSVNKGEIFGLIGPNGAGKTTLFNAITGFLKPDSGDIFFQNERITNYEPYLVSAKGLCRTFQGTKNFSDLDVFDNIFVGALTHFDSRKMALQKTQEVLDFVGLTDKSKNLLTKLTLTEKKKVEIARMLATCPNLLLIDEIIAGLPSPDVDDIVELILKINHAGITIVFVEHVMRVVMNISNSIVVLVMGRNISEGSPEMISKDEKVIEAYLGREDEDV
jgi:branched-chain amino acid transport system ATP-binding protein